MTDADFKKAISEALCDEYIASIPEHNADHEFADEFHAKMNKLVKRRRRPYYMLINTAFKRTVATAAVIMLLFVAPLSVRAVREGAYSFVMRVFTDHTELSVATTDNNYPKTIENEYTIPELESWDMEVWSNDKQSILKYYTNGDKTAIFGQFTIDSYTVELESEEADYKPYTDENGQKYLVSKSATGISIVWNNREYVFILVGDFNKEDAIKLCRTTEIKENSELLSQQWQ